jgi:hypothetical protein
VTLGAASASLRLQLRNLLKSKHVITRTVAQYSALESGFTLVANLKTLFCLHLSMIGVRIFATNKKFMPPFGPPSFRFDWNATPK